jgi:hypothetical protein
MTCPTCGESLDEGVSKCPKCSPVLKVGSDHLGIKGNSVGTIVATPPDHPGGTRVDYRPPSGDRSLSQERAPDCRSPSESEEGKK